MSLDQKVKNQIKRLKLNNTIVFIKSEGPKIHLQHLKSKEIVVTSAYSFLGKTQSNLYRIFQKTYTEAYLKEETIKGRNSSHPYECLEINYAKQRVKVRSLKTKKIKWVLKTSLKLNSNPFQPNYKPGTSTGEESVISFFSKVLKVSFKKVRPSWLKNHKTNLPLELDGYCEKLNLAIEYGSHKKSHKNSFFFDDQEYVIFKDKLKAKLCKKNNVKLLVVKDLSPNSNSEEIKSYLKSLLIEQNISFDEQLFNKTKFIFIERSGSYSKQEIWDKVNSCKNRDAFERKYRGYWRAGERLGIISDIIKHFQSKRNMMTVDRAIMLAKKYHNPKKFRDEQSAASSLLYKHNLHRSATAHMTSVQKGHGYWKDLKNAENALKTCKTRSELRSKYSALANNMKSYPEHYKSLLKKYPQFKVHIKTSFSEQEILEKIKKYTKYIDLLRAEPHFVSYLKHFGLLDKYTNHLIKKVDIVKESKNKELKKRLSLASKYKDIDQLKEKDFGTYNYLRAKKALNLAFKL